MLGFLGNCPPLRSVTSSPSPQPRPRRYLNPSFQAAFFPVASMAFNKQQCLYFNPLPHGQRAFRPYRRRPENGTWSYSKTVISIPNHDVPLQVLALLAQKE